MQESYSQIGQDIAVIKFYNEMYNGYFIELGAYDGITLSNTYLLEKKFKWKGICIEPLNNYFMELTNNRKCICLKKLVYSENNLYLDFSDADVLSGIVNDIDCHIDRINNVGKIMETTTMTKILNDNNAPTFIEYLSLDTEGSEYEILKGIDFNKYIFGYINIEHNFVEPRRTITANFLKDKGYVYIGENRFDDNYIHHSLIIGKYNENINISYVNNEIIVTQCGEKNKINFKNSRGIYKNINFDIYIDRLQFDKNTIWKKCI